MRVPSLELAVTALVLAAMYVTLGVRVARLRVQLRVGIGEGNKPEHRPLKRAIRVHGNFAEWVPLTLLVLLIADLRGADPTLVGGLGAALVVSRIGHAVGLSRSIRSSLGRSGGVALTLCVLLVAAITAVVV